MGEDGGEIDQLFDASADPEERLDVFEEKPAVSDALGEQATRFLEPKETVWGVAPTRVEIDEMELNQLRALGYQID